MSYTDDENPGMSLATDTNLFTELSETEQESVSGGLFFYYNQTNINSGADFNNSFTGSLGDASGSGTGTGANGTFTGSGSSNYQLNSTTFILSGSDQMMFYMLPSILKFMTNFGI
jgi:hypothetical protein